MIIRGNTVSTTIAPEKIAEKIGNTGGGISPLIVTLDKSTGKASHTATEIFEHLSGEKANVLLYNSSDGYYPMMRVNRTTAIFGSGLETGENFYYIIRDDGSYQFVETSYVSQEELTGSIGDISSALDELHTYAQGLIGGAAE